MFVPGYMKLIKASVDRFVMFEDGVSLTLALAVKHYDKGIEFTEELISKIDADTEKDEGVVAPLFKNLYMMDFHLFDDNFIRSVVTRAATDGSPNETTLISSHLSDGSINDLNKYVGELVTIVAGEEFKADLMADFKIKDEDTFFDKVFSGSSKKFTKIKEEYARLLNLVNTVVLEAFSSKTSYAATEVDTDEVLNPITKVVH
nr:MAG TPA: hypothetical protein [Caudoviricetes sp.]